MGHKGHQSRNQTAPTVTLATEGGARTRHQPPTHNRNCTKAHLCVTGAWGRAASGRAGAQGAAPTRASLQALAAPPGTRHLARVTTKHTSTSSKTAAHLLCRFRAEVSGQRLACKRLENQAMHRIPAVHCCHGGLKCGKAMRTEGVHPKAVRGEGAVGLHQRLRGVTGPLPHLHGCALSHVTPEGENTALKGSPVRGVSPTLMSSTLHGLTKPSTRTVALTGFLHVHKRTASPPVRKLTRTRGKTDLAGEAGRAGAAAGLAAFAADCPWRFRVIGGLGARFPPVSAANTAAGMSAAFFAGGGAASAPLPSPSLSSYSTAASKSSPVRRARSAPHGHTRTNGATHSAWAV